MTSDFDHTGSTALPLATIIPSCSTTLPVEVCERIVDFCSYDAQGYGRQGLLHACALVCRDWLPRSRFHLYYYIPLRTEQDFVQFFHSVQKNTLLGTFVHILRLGESQVDNSFQGLEEGEGIQTTGVVRSPPPRLRHTANWIIHVPLRLLPLLPILCRIEIHCLPAFNGTTQMFLSKFRNCRTVTQLSLACCQFPSSQDLLRFLSCFPLLEEVALISVTIINTSSFVADRYLRTLPTLDFLTIWGVSDATLMDGLATWPILSHVQTLGYQCNQGVMVRGLEQVLLRCSPTIVSVDIMLLEEGGLFFHPPDAPLQITLPERVELSLASNLQRLQICIRLGKGAENWLGTLSLPTNIEDIALSLLLSADSLSIVLSQPWATFDASLSSPEFTRLERVQLIIHERELSEQDRSDLHLAMNDTLPKLRKRGTLHLAYRTHDHENYESLWN